MRIHAAIAAGTAVLLTAVLAFGSMSWDDVKLLNKAAFVLSDFRNAVDIPESIWSKAQCVLVIPALRKADFITGDAPGAGVMSCRQSNDAWGTPIFVQFRSGSAQAAVQSADLAIFVMKQETGDRILADTVTLGTDASVAAGPIGLTAAAATDTQLTAQMLSYSHSQGVFAGIDLSGGSVNIDTQANTRAYGDASAKDIVMGTTPVDESAQARSFITAFEREERATTGVK